MTRLVLLCCLLAPPGLAVAQPRLIPNGDVSVTYRVEGAAVDQIPGGAPNGVQLVWDAAGQRLRAEPVGGPVYAIVDLARRSTDIVFAAQRSILQLPLRNGDAQSLLGFSNLQFTRRGAGHVLGIECTEWIVHARKLDGTGCVTADGIILRAEGQFDGRPGTVKAVAVGRGQVQWDAFSLPDGFFRLPLGVR